MMQSPPRAELTPMRKGVKSCIECRARKVRCIWDENNHSGSCDNCIKRGVKCAPQLFKRKATNEHRVTSRDRISDLEQRLETIYAAVKNHQGIEPSHSEESSQDHDEREAPDHHQETNSHGPGGPALTHLNLLFDNDILELGEHQTNDSALIKQSSCSEKYLNKARAELQSMIPDQTDVLNVCRYATSWMSIYHSLLPSIATAWSSAGLTAQYDIAIKPDAHPVNIGMFLLSMAITARQVPQEPDKRFSRWNSISEWLSAAVAAVEVAVISHSGLAGTLDGIELMTIYLRVQLGLGNMRTWWLALRRTIALSELLGLPRTAYRLRSATNPTIISNHERGWELWRMICSIDRMSSMMYNLPTATGTHRLPSISIMQPDGQVLIHAFLFQLSSVSIKVQELDDLHGAGELDDDFYAKVLAADHHLRSLAAQTPSSWWNLSTAHPPWVHMTQSWHSYGLVRVHLHSAMSKENRNRFLYSRMACLAACENMAVRYTILRPMLPPGFFLCRIIDMQIFTAVVFLLLSYHADDIPISPQISSGSGGAGLRHLVLEVIKIMESVVDHVGNEFVREAVPALKSLHTHFDDGTGSQNWTLKIPLLGQIRIRRKAKKQDLVNADQQMMHEDYGSLMSMTGTMSTAATASSAMGDGMGMGSAGLSDTPPWLLELDINTLQPDILAFESWSDWNQFPSLDGML